MVFVCLGVFVCLFVCLFLFCMHTRQYCFLYMYYNQCRQADRLPSLRAKCCWFFVHVLLSCIFSSVGLIFNAL